MASNINTFYSDNSGGCPALTPANENFTSLAEIFQAITTGLTSPRLIPNGTDLGQNLNGRKTQRLLKGTGT